MAVYGASWRITFFHFSVDDFLQQRQPLASLFDLRLPFCPANLAVHWAGRPAYGENCRMGGRTKTVQPSKKMKKVLNREIREFTRKIRLLIPRPQRDAEFSTTNEH